MPNDPKKEFEFTFSNPDLRSLTLEGSDGGNEIRVKLDRVDESQSALLGSRLHWINEDADFVTDEENVCDHLKPAGMSF
jgi:hypothetical protein